MMDFSTSILRNTSRSAGGKDDAALPPRDDPFHYGPTFLEPYGSRASGTMHDGAAIVSRTTDTADSLTMDIYSGQALRSCASGGSSKMRGMQQQKGISCDSDDMHSADDWKPEQGKAECDEGGMSFSGNEGNDATQLLTGEGTMKATLSRAPVPFCCLPGNPKHTFLVGMVLIMVLFLCVPIGCLMALETLHTYRERDVAHAINLYVSTAALASEGDAIRDTMHLLAFFGRFLPEETIDPSILSGFGTLGTGLRMPNGAAVPVPIAALYGHVNSVLIAALMQTADSDLSESALRVRRMLTSFHEKEFVESLYQMLEQQERMARAHMRSYVREEIFDKIFNSEAAAAIARAPNLMQEARLACMDLEPCWTGEAREVIEGIATGVNMISAGASLVISDIFLLIEDPRRSATNLQEMISGVLQRQRLYTSRLATLDKWSEDVARLLKVLTDLEDTSIAPGDPVLVTAESLALFVLPRGWSGNVTAVVVQTLEVAHAVSEHYQEKGPIEMWLNDGAEDELSADFSKEQILSCVHIFESYFGINISSSLELEVTPELEAENTEKFNAVLANTFVDGLDTLLSGELEVVKKSAAKCILSESEYTPVRVARELLLVLIFSLSLSALLYVAVLYVIRYRLASSPFPFHGLMLVLLTLFILQCIVSVMTYLMTMGQDGSKHFLTPEFLLSSVVSLDYLYYYSKLMSDALSLALLIEPNVTYAATKYEELGEALEATRNASGDSPWLVPVADFFEVVLGFVGDGFLPVRHQLTAAPALALMADVLRDVVGGGVLNENGESEAAVKDVRAKHASCWSGIGAAAANTLSTSFVTLTAISERLSRGISRSRVLPVTAVSRAALEANCVAAIMESAVDPTKPECFISEICSVPSDFGLLRDVKSSVGVYQLFDPTSRNGMGRILNMWREAKHNSIPREFKALLDGVSESAMKDFATIVNSGRLIVWMNIFAFFVFQGAMTWLWGALFGRPSFIVFR